MKKIQVSMLLILGMGSLCASDAQLVVLEAKITSAPLVQDLTGTEKKEELLRGAQPRAQVSEDQLAVQSEKETCLLCPCCYFSPEHVRCKSKKKRGWIERCECVTGLAIYYSFCCCFCEC